MKYEFFDSESDRILSWNELQDGKYIIRAGENGFYLIDTSREDEDGYYMQLSGEWRRSKDN